MCAEERLSITEGSVEVSMMAVTETRNIEEATKLVLVNVVK